MSAFSKTDFNDLGVNFTSYASGVIACTTVTAVDEEVEAGDVLVVNDNRELSFWVKGVSTTRGADDAVTANNITIEYLKGGTPADTVLASVAADAELSIARVPTSSRARADHVYGIESTEERANKRVSHAGWVVKKTFPQEGRRAHRVQYETLVAMGGMQPGTKHFDHLIVNRVGPDTIVLTTNTKTIDPRSFFDHIHAGTDFSVILVTGQTYSTVFTPTPTNFNSGSDRTFTVRGPTGKRTERFYIRADDGGGLNEVVTNKEIVLKEYDTLTRNATGAPTNFGSPSVADTNNSHTVTFDLDTYFTAAGDSITAVGLRNRPTFIRSFAYDASSHVVTFISDGSVTPSTSIQIRVSGYDADGAPTHYDFRVYVQSAA